jgi:TolA-binding protein
MRLVWSLVAILLMASSSLNAADQRPVVAVFDVQTKFLKISKAKREMLTELLGQMLGVGGVYQVMPPGDVKKALLEQSSESYKKCYDEKCQIEFGRNLPANKLVTTTILKAAGKCRVTSSLYDLKRQTTDIMATEKERCNEAGYVDAVEKVAAKLRAIRTGTADSPGFVEEDLGEKPGGDWAVEGGKDVIVTFTSDPSGALVLVNGKMVCKETPCSKSVAKGKQLVSMQADRHREKKQRIAIVTSGMVSWKLEPNFGWLTVRSEPSGLDVTVNGTRTGQTPNLRGEREPGIYRVMVTSPCHYDSGKKVRIERGKEKEVSFKITSKMGALNVRAMDDKGNDLSAAVEIDGRKVGNTPGVYKTSICSKRLVVKHDKFGSAEKSLSIREKKVSKVEVTLKSTARLANKYWGGGKPRPLLSYEKFRRQRKMRIQPESKRKAIRKQLQALLKYEKGPKEKPALLFRLAKNYFVESLAAKKRGKKIDADKWSIKAIDTFNKIITGFPRYPDLEEVYFLLAGSLWDHGRVKGSLKIYRRLIKDYPKSKYIPEAYMAFGEYYFDAAKLEKALMAYKKVAQYNKAEIYPFAIYKQGWCYYRLQYWKKAKDMFGAVVLLHESVVMAAEHKGTTVSDEQTKLKNEAQMVLAIIK